VKPFFSSAASDLLSAVAAKISVQRMPLSFGFASPPSAKISSCWPARFSASSRSVRSSVSVRTK
jgi:hypothetical protein